MIHAIILAIRHLRRVTKLTEGQSDKHCRTTSRQLWATIYHSLPRRRRLSNQISISIPILRAPKGETDITTVQANIAIESQKTDILPPRWIPSTSSHLSMLRFPHQPKKRRSNKDREDGQAGGIHPAIWKVEQVVVRPWYPPEQGIIPLDQCHYLTMSTSTTTVDSLEWAAGRSPRWNTDVGWTLWHNDAEQSWFSKSCWQGWSWVYFWGWHLAFQMNSLGTLECIRSLLSGWTVFLNDSGRNAGEKAMSSHGEVSAIGILM